MHIQLPKRRPMQSKLSAIALVASLIALAGCGPRPISGGTQGTLCAEDGALGEVQLTVYEAEGDGWRTIGFADTNADGTFELVTVGAKERLVLSPGEYRCTLESVGAPIVFPPQYAAAETTPLRVVWPSADGRLDLTVPISLSAR